MTIELKAAGRAAAVAHLLLWAAMLVPASSAGISCLTAFVNRNFNERSFPAGTFQPARDPPFSHLYNPGSGVRPEDTAPFTSCIAYTVNGTIRASAIGTPEYSEEILLNISGVDGQGTMETCDTLINPSGFPTPAFMAYVYAGRHWDTLRGKVYTCCNTTLCNGAELLVLSVVANDGLMRLVSSTLVLGVGMFSTVLLALFM